jgi:DNA-binding response OmpR family regulator
MGETIGRAASLALLIDADPAMRPLLQPFVGRHGLEIIHARSSVGALELLQRLPGRFRLALVSLEMPGLSGLVLLETLKLFRPGTATLCLASTDGAPVAAAGANCLKKPVRASDLRTRIAEALAGAVSPSTGYPIGAEALARARASFALSGNLLEAARELARAVPGTPPEAW